MRRRARPTLPLSWLPSPPATHDACEHPNGVYGITNSTINDSPIIATDVNGSIKGIRGGSGGAPRAPVRSNSLIARRDQELDAHTQLTLARLDETAALRRIERAERLIKIQAIEGLVASLVPVGGEEVYDEGSERSMSVLTA